MFVLFSITGIVYLLSVCCKNAGIIGKGVFVQIEAVWELMQHNVFLCVSFILIGYEWKAVCV